MHAKKGGRRRKGTAGRRSQIPFDELSIESEVDKFARRLQHHNIHSKTINSKRRKILFILSFLQLSVPVLCTAGDYCSSTYGIKSKPVPFVSHLPGPGSSRMALHRKPRVSPAAPRPMFQYLRLQGAKFDYESGANAKDWNPPRLRARPAGVGLRPDEYLFKF